MSLIQDIQLATITPNYDIPTLLRMCKLLAARISYNDLEEWVDRELNGYQNKQALPDYRIATVTSYGSFASYSHQLNKLQIPVTVLPEELQDNFRYTYMTAGVSFYVGLLSNDKADKVLQYPWPIVTTMKYVSRSFVDMDCLSAWQEIPCALISRLLDSIKTRVLGFAIDLEREAPNAGELPIGSSPPLSSEKMTQIFNTNISGNVSNLSNSGRDFSQNTESSVHHNNWGSLEYFLLQNGLTSDNISELKDQVDALSYLQEGVERESKVRKLADSLSKKAVSSVVGVSVEVISSSFAKAIASYLGFPMP